MKKKFYNLKEIEQLTELKYRQLQNRILTIKEKYKEKKHLIFKLKGKWHISAKIIFEFERKREPINYKLFTTIASKNKFEFEYWYLIIKSINKQITNNLDKYNRLKFVIEETKRGYYHLHFLTTYNNKNLLKNLINNNVYINENEMNILIKDIYNITEIHKYLNKEKKPKLFKKIY